jgi:hypothetical protein
MKITTHSVYGGSYFSAEVDGVPLIGANGGISLFQSRKEAREEAKRRMELPHNQAKEPSE